MSHYHFSIKPHGIMKNGEKIDTQVHYRYICREGKYSNLDGHKEDLVYTMSGNLPVWACNNPDEFWKQAEANRGAHNNGYREFLLGLQEELSLRENIELIETLMEKTGIATHHVYTYAIHDKAAAFDKEHRNIHCHLMFNDKILEKDRPLDADKFFKRYSQDKEGNSTQGYKVERKFQQKQTILELRKFWQDIVNEKLEQKAVGSRVDCRTLEEQYAEKMSEGKADEARYFNRKPPLHLGAGFQNPEEREEMRKKSEQNFRAELNGEPVIYPEPTTSHEIKKVVFIRDFVVRKVAKYLQAVKLEKLEKAKKLMDYASYIEGKQEAMVITNTDIIEYEKDNIQSLKDAIKELDKAYRVLAPKIVSNKKSMALAMYDVYRDEYNRNKNNPAQIKIYMQDSKVLAKADVYQKEIYMNLAKDKFLGDEYRKLKSDYEKARAEKAALVKEYNRLKEMLYVNKTPELIHMRLATYKALEANNELTHRLAARINEYNEVLLKGENQTVIASIAADIEKKNTSNVNKLKEIYANKVKAQLTLKQAENILSAAKELAEDTIVFADKIQPLAVPETKLYGEIKLGSLEMVQLENETYCILPETIDPGNVRAVKLFDDILKGKVPVYKLEKTQTLTDGKNAAKTIVKATAEKIPVYKVRTKASDNLPPAYRLIKENAILKAIDKAIETKDISLTPLWPEADNTVVDELEKELEQERISNYIKL